MALVSLVKSPAVQVRRLRARSKGFLGAVIVNSYNLDQSHCIWLLSSKSYGECERANPVV